MNGAEIHDLGYRHYHGVHTGARSVWLALFVEGVRAMFGIGRSTRAKAIPILSAVLVLLPSLGTVIAASTNGAPIRHALLIGAQLMIFVLFAAAQVPELLCRDRQYRVLALLWTRVSPRQYATARVASVLVSMWLMAMAPLLLLYLGDIGAASDPGLRFAEMGGRIWPMLLHATLSAWVIGSIAVLMASLTSRRGIASASVVAVIILAAVVTKSIEEVTEIPMRVVEFLDPLRALQTVAMLLFHETTRAMELVPPPSWGTFVIVLLGVGSALVVTAVIRIEHFEA